MSEQIPDFREADKKQYWYVDNLPANRPLWRRAISRDQWIAMVRKLHEGKRHGKRYVMTLCGEVDIDGKDSAEWKDILRSVIVGSGSRIFWEPTPPRKRREKTTSLW